MPEIKNWRKIVIFNNMNNFYLNDINYIYKNNFLYFKKYNFGKIKIPNNIDIVFENNYLIVKKLNCDLSIFNTFLSNIKNLIIGIQDLWIKKLEYSGIGYKIIIKNKILIFFLGYTNSVNILIPMYINVDITKNNIILKSVYKDKLGIFAEKITKIKKYNPYKKKGIFFLNKFFLKKSSKKKQ